MTPEDRESLRYDPDHVTGEVLRAIDDAVLKDDWVFFKELVDGQNVLDKADIAEYLYRTSQESEEPQLQQIYREYLQDFTDALDIDDISPRDMDRIGDILMRAEEDEMAEIADMQHLLKKKQAERHHEIEADFDWEEDIFEVYISKERTKAIEKSVVFEEAVALLNGTRDPRSRSRDASATVEEQVAAGRAAILRQVPSGEHRSMMLELLDKHIFALAEQYAKGQIASEKEPIDAAVTLVKAYASTELSERKMRICLDKYIFRKARDYRTGREKSNTSGYLAATSLIRSFASSEARAKGMFEALGFIQAD